jgi:hypothetical protein
MKKLFYLLLAVALPVMALAQAPNNFNYQAVVRNSAGQPIVSGPVTLRFSIREGTPTGSILFQETQNKMILNKNLCLKFPAQMYQTTL